MSSDLFSQPEGSDLLDPNRVRRSASGRPYVKCPCPGDCGGTGRVPSEKREGKTVQCPKCLGRGQKEVLFTRCTSFVGVLDDRSVLERWQKRTVLRGLAAAPEVFDRVRAVQPDDPDDVLNQIANDAFEAGDGYEKARKGTDLHKLSEFVDSGEPLPDELWNHDAQAFRPVTLQDRADMAAYVRTRDELNLVYLDRELFVVNDELQIGGTFDGLVGFDGAVSSNPAHPRLVCNRPVIVDLKTGRVDYGQGKIAQQLAVYAHSERYDPATGERTPLDACPHRGIVIHLPQGTGDATAMTVDLEQGWKAVQLSDQVRSYRRESKSYMWETA